MAAAHRAALAAARRGRSATPSSRAAGQRLRGGRGCRAWRVTCAGWRSTCSRTRRWASSPTCGARATRCRRSTSSTRSASTSSRRKCRRASFLAASPFHRSRAARSGNTTSSIQMLVVSRIAAKSWSRNRCPSVDNQAANKASSITKSACDCSVSNSSCVGSRAYCLNAQSQNGEKATPYPLPSAPAMSASFCSLLRQRSACSLCWASDRESQASDHTNDTGRRAWV